MNAIIPTVVALVVLALVTFFIVGAIIKYLIAVIKYRRYRKANPEKPKPASPPEFIQVREEVSKELSQSLGISTDSEEELRDIDLDIEFDVVGTVYRSESAIEKVRKLKPGDSLTLVAEFDNPYDESAVKVCTPDGDHIGYVPKKNSELVRSFISDMDRCVVVKRSKHKIPFVRVFAHFHSEFNKN